MVRTELVEGRIEEKVEDTGPPDRGAELVFRGRVRGKESRRIISALHYEHYPGMAERQLQALAEQAAKRFAILDLICRHRIGRVPVGEISLEVCIRSRHRKEGLEAMDFFIAELKKSVPIWKWAVLPDGRKVPGGHHPAGS
ncbi:MAG: molybdenum cofactor biosynthesis protein MoaE [Fidelibacterota bacterium]